ncbi:insulinase family protein [Carnimonas bestiolae]|uniref:insulinase family protein n=1 Tax=Carnimonas bestiolae TaxID=3402172 RepID=UPI003EDC10FF
MPAHSMRHRALLIIPALVISAGIAAPLPSAAWAAPQQASSQQSSTALPGLPPYAPDSQQVHKSPNDKADYRALRLPNGLEVLLVHDDRADRAAAAVNVRVGSSADPKDVPGLAHFNEHMLFLGTDRYPQASNYQDYLGNHGGNSNAFTADRDTNYFFDIPPAAFTGAFDRFARFFVAPRFNASHVNQERHAIDSEYHMGLRNENRRTWDALSHAINPAHPFAHFAVGNLDTLKDGQQPLRQRLLEFYRQHYSADRMTLTMMGPQSLDTLEHLARTRFSDVPEHKVAQTNIDVPLFAQGQLPEKVEVKSNVDGRNLSFNFPVPDSERYPRSQPDNYLANLIGHEGPGSILAALRHAGLADGLSTGLSRSDGNHALFTVSVELTPKGAQHQDDVQATLFAYIDKIRQGGIEQWRFDEQSTLLRQHYPFEQTSSDANRASGLSMAMARLPVSEINVAGYRMDHFDPDLIKHYLDQMRPDNLLRVYASPDVKGSQQSQWYHTPYTLTHVEHWPQAQAVGQLALPERNTFIAKDFTLEKVQDPRPRRLINQPGMDLWYQGNHSFGTPSVNWSIALFSPLKGTDVREGLLTTMLAGWLNDSLSESLYPAALAGQTAGASVQRRGIAIDLSGWRDRQPEIFDTLIHQLKDAPIDQASFDRLSQQFKDDLNNQRQGYLYHSLMRVIPDQLITPEWNSARGLDELNHITLEDLRQFRERWLKSLHVTALAVGNLTQDDAIASAKVLDQLKPRVAVKDIPALQTLSVSDNLPAFRPTTESTDAGALVVKTIPDTKLATKAAWSVLGQLLSSPFYDSLRTEQQLGYVVSADYTAIMRAGGIAMLVQSPTHSSQQLFDRINDFTEQFSPTIDKLDDATLAHYKSAIRSQLLERDHTLGELASSQWSLLNLQELNFDYRQRLALAVDRLSVADIKAAWKTFKQAPALKAASDKGVPPNDRDYNASDSLKPFTDS